MAVLLEVRRTDKIAFMLPDILSPSRLPEFMGYGRWNGGSSSPHPVDLYFRSEFIVCVFVCFFCLLKDDFDVQRRGYPCRLSGSIRRLDHRTGIPLQLKPLRQCH